MKLNEFSRAVEKLKEEQAKYKQSSKTYKEKLRMANSTIKILTQKVAQYEIERQAERDVDLIRVGSQHIGEGHGRESH